MLLSSLIEKLCTKEENNKAGCTLTYGEQCIIIMFYYRMIMLFSPYYNSHFRLLVNLFVWTVTICIDGLLIQIELEGQVYFDLILSVLHIVLFESHNVKL